MPLVRKRAWTPGRQAAVWLFAALGTVGTLAGVLLLVQAQNDQQRGTGVVVVFAGFFSYVVAAKAYVPEQFRLGPDDEPLDPDDDRDQPGF